MDDCEGLKEMCCCLADAGVSLSARMWADFAIPLLCFLYSRSKAWNAFEDLYYIEYFESYEDDCKLGEAS